MSELRLVNPDVAQMAGTCALPRMSGELLFNDDWERRAFAIAVCLAEQGHFAWHEFQQELIEAIADAHRCDPQNPRGDYYASWLVALEALLRRKRLGERRFQRLRDFRGFHFRGSGG